MPNAAPIIPPQNLESCVDAINRNLTDIDRNVWEKANPEYPEVAKIESTTRWVDEFLAVQGLAKPIANRDLEAPPQVAPVRGNKTAIRQVSYRSQLTVEETAMRVADHKQVYDNLEDLIESFKTLKDQVAVDVFNNGTTGSQTYGITEFDGTNRALFSTGHYYENGNGTWSNYVNVGVPPNIDTVWQVFNQYLNRLYDHNGNFINWPREITILTPSLTPAFGVAAEEIVKSQDRPDTANRATNILRSLTIKHRVLNNLTSSTKWYIAIPTSHRAYPFIMRQLIDREITPLEKVGPVNPHAYVMTGRSQFGIGFKYSYRGIVAIGT
jgi:hypothetical protein